MELTGELVPVTEPGRVLIERISGVEDELASAAERADRTGEYAHRSIALLQRIGVPGAATPSELGGLGLASAHDFAVLVNRIGRADGSAALIVNMHLFRMLLYARVWRLLRSLGGIDPDPFGDLLRRVATENLMVAALATEPGTDHLHLRTTATQVDGRWWVSGRKGFATGSPGADLLGVVCRYERGDGDTRIGALLVPAASEGIEHLDNWDSLGMRASGSQDIVFDDCAVDGDMIDLGAYGEFSDAYLLSNALGFVGLAGAFLGIAETAHHVALDVLRRRDQHDRPAFQMTVAESECDLATSRALLARTAGFVDEALAEQTFSFELDRAHQLMKDLQCTKHVVTHAAIRVTDRAMTMSGGSGYANANVLSRLYRDARAGPFMQPFSPNDALEYIGQVALTGSSTIWSG